MIADLTDKEILDFLMTSDFNENLSPDEMRFLLLKFRNFFRVYSSKNEVLLTEVESLKKQVENLPSMIKQIDELRQQNQNLSDELNTIMNKKLSFKERIFGKIIE